MASPLNTFRAKAPGVMRQLMADFRIADFHAAAIVGNLGHESGGFTKFQEERPTVPGSRGGWGWAQWTGPRRRAFEEFCRENKLDPRSDKANYAYLWRELSGNQPGFDYSGCITQLRRTKTLVSAVESFEKCYEKSGVKNWPSRRMWAARALDAYHDAGGEGGVDAQEAVRRIQARLHELGHGEVVGPVDGIIGPRTLEGIAAALGVDSES